MLVWHSLVSQEANTLTLWYDKPATRFEEALPLGNGRIGIMVYGGIEKETINLNEATLWGGGPTNTKAPDSTTYFLEKVREKLFEEQWSEASKLLRNIQGANSQSFVPMGNISLEQQFLSNKQPLNYHRELDLSTATNRTTFSVDTIDYRREVFVSAPDQVVVIKYTASKKGGLNLSINGNTPFENATIKGIGNNEFVLSGQLPADIQSPRQIPLMYVTPEGRKGMRYQYRIKAIPKDGSVTTDPSIQIKDATEVLLFISATTSFNGFDKRPDIQGVDDNKLAQEYLINAENITFDELKKKHIADYQSFFNRIHFELDDNKVVDLPTDKRLENYTKGQNDPSLESLYFHFGRYLLISSSRPNGVAANLQGIWNKDKRPSWGSNYTVNINLQMNYWPAEMFALSDLAEPLIHQIKNMAVTGKKIARNYYNMKGWAAHHNSDIWAHTNPVGNKTGDPKWANWSLGSPWLSQHLYEHYRYTTDKEFLNNTAYPIMKGAAEFCLDWLVEKDGYLVTAPSTSPENVFIDDKGNKGVVTIGSAMDLEIIWDLLNNLIEASVILDMDKVERQKWIVTQEKLFPLRIGTNGNLIEWYKDWKDADPQHRHVSHLFGLHPGRQISPIITPELAKASTKTLEDRGDGGTGWSKAWKINFQARLLDGEHAYKMYRELLATSTLPNLFDTHPPFQIDGNFGGISGVGEMLLQSHLDEIHLLPALPQKWQKGKIEGMKARGGYTVDINWNNGKISSGKIQAKIDNFCKIRTNSPIKIKGASSRSKKEGNFYITTFNAKSGKSYSIE